MKSLKSIVCAFAAICLIPIGGLLITAPVTGCAGTNWSNVGSTLITDVQDGTVLATEAYAAYTAVNQQLTTSNVLTGKLDATKVLAAATAVNSGLQTPGLASAVQSFVADANSTLTALKGSAPPKVIAAVSEQGAATVSTIAALPNPVSTTPPTPATSSSAPANSGSPSPLFTASAMDGKSTARFKVTLGLRPIYGWHNPYSLALAR